MEQVVAVMNLRRADRSGGDDEDLEC